MSQNIKKLLEPKAQRHILTVDGGGIRGLIALGALKQIELILSEQSGKPDFRLADYFDLIPEQVRVLVLPASTSRLSQRVPVNRRRSG
jgi:hypothetical protein